MGFIYLIRSLDDYKIGYTKNKTIKRKKQHDTGNPEELDIVYIYETKYNQKLERILHRRFSSHHKKGEWYTLPFEAVQGFLGTCEQIEESLDVLKDNPFI